MRTTLSAHLKHRFDYNMMRRCTRPCMKPPELYIFLFYKHCHICTLTQKSPNMTRMSLHSSAPKSKHPHGRDKPCQRLRVCKAARTPALCHQNAVSAYSTLRRDPCSISYLWYKVLQSASSRQPCTTCPCTSKPPNPVICLLLGLRSEKHRSQVRGCASM